MLTKMPKVGDVLIANEGNIAETMCDLTGGKEYVITEVDEDGDACFLDDIFDRRYIDVGRFKLFTLKADAEPVGSMRLIELESHGRGKYKRAIVVYTDDEGLATIRKLAEQSESQRKRTELQTKIDALQKEMDAI